MPEDTFEETFGLDANGEAQAPSTETPTSETQPVAQTPPPEYLSKQDFEQWKQSYDAQAQARLQEVIRTAQVIKDKARETAIRKAQALETDSVPAFRKAGVELTEEQIGAAKRAVIEQEFWTTDATGSPLPSPVPAASPVVSRREIIDYLKAQGVDEKDFPVGDYAGEERGEEINARFQSDLAAARVKKDQAKQQRAAGQQAAQVAAAFGGTATPAATSAGAPADPQK